MGSSRGDRMMLIHRFASGKVKNHGAIFGTQVKDAHCPLTHITIEADGTLHGWKVIVAGNRGQARENSDLTDFAASMKGLMKIHFAEIRTMKDPYIRDLN